MDYIIQDLQQQISKEQAKLLEQIKNNQDNQNEVKKLDKKLDALNLLGINIIKFKRIYQ